MPSFAAAPEPHIRKDDSRQETIARGSEAIFISDEEGVSRFGGNAAYAIALPKVHPFVTPLLYSIPVQLLAYHTAVCSRAPT